MSEIFPDWMTVRLGTYQSHEEIRARYDELGMRIGTEGWSIFWQTPLAASPTDVTLGIASAEALGFTESTTLRLLFEKIVSLGGSLCDGEDALHARLGFLDQVFNDEVFVAMNPAAPAPPRLRGYARVFRLCNHGIGLTLDAESAHPERVVRPRDQWVFRI